MSIRPDPVIPETRRRRASTTEKSERILKMSRSLTLTRSVLAGTLAEATPNQLDFIERWFTAELDSREQSKRLRLLIELRHLQAHPAGLDGRGPLFVFN